MNVPPIQEPRERFITAKVCLTVGVGCKGLRVSMELSTLTSIECAVFQILPSPRPLLRGRVGTILNSGFVRRLRPLLPGIRSRHTVLKSLRCRSMLYFGRELEHRSLRSV